MLNHLYISVRIEFSSSTNLFDESKNRQKNLLWGTLVLEKCVAKWEVILRAPGFLKFLSLCAKFDFGWCFSGITFGTETSLHRASENQKKNKTLLGIRSVFFKFYSLALDDRPNCIIYLFLCFHRVLLDSRILISRIISREPQQKRPIIYQNCSFEFRTTKLHIYARNKQ